MARSTGTTLAVPRAALAADGSALAFEPLGWKHLAAYLDKVEHMPGDARALTPALAAAFGALAETVHGFGTPAQLAADPALVDAQDRPELPYAAFAWTVHRLHGAARDTLAALRACTTPGATPQLRRESLQGLGALAARARDQASALLPEVQQFRTSILRAHHQFGTAMAGISGNLQSEWEAVGAQRARLENLQAQLQQTSILHPHKRHELGTQIRDAEQELSVATAKAEQLRQNAAALNELVQEGAWLDTCLGGITDFLQNLRAAWAAFGAAMTQLAADATDALLADAAWLDSQLEPDEALPRWQALAEAADQFCVQAAVLQQPAAMRKVNP
ncbi:MAG: hypothetical protein ACXWC4_08180 [Telluria sp.]